MKNIQVLPTDKPSRLKQNKITKKISLVNKGIDLTSYTPINIFITSDEEIKDCWVFNTLTNQVYFLQGFYGRQIVKKIILTTDQDLDGVQSIDDEFLEWFVQNPSCDFVEVERGYLGMGGFCKSSEIISKDKIHYKIIIPKEEPKQEWTPTQGEQVWIKVFSNWSSGTYIGYDTTKHIHLVRENEEGGGNLLSSSKILPYKSMPNETKQETLEEAAHKMLVDYGIKSMGQSIGVLTVKKLMVDMAQWQQERMYSEEEVLELLRKAHFVEQNIDEWFEQFKK